MLNPLHLAGKIVCARNGVPNVGTGVEGNQGQVKRLKLFRPLNQVGDDIDLVPVPILVLGKLRDIEFNRCSVLDSGRDMGGCAPPVVKLRR